MVTVVLVVYADFFLNSWTIDYDSSEVLTTVKQRTTDDMFMSYVYITLLLLMMSFT
jgi:hypothetical protein